MDITSYIQELKGKTATEILAFVAENYADEAVFSTSFGYEDQVITDLIAQHNFPIALFTLETGRLFRETYAVWSRTLARYPLAIKPYFPDTEALQEFVNQTGPNGFYASVENRKSCCGIRKIEPLKRALKGYKIWITGIRADQSPNRQDMHNVEFDEGNNLIKIHPLFDWSLTEVKEYIKKNNVPYNILHDRGFPSIGCAPCTRAVQEGEDFRAGRWWWEDQSKKECGLHSITK
ncbi:phosphoadenylyl-sulfate reductase [Sphingobacteriaceae bacterium WQ 2009]|uniref:Adenosine 5'-phosphosulfate reductase n=1 Tax=Rhinopithecimicrobium faecis TaxID=2820698 RepID=A0A8T4H959_9SPHI|nr:phosphoadenylyl-sulfate reductase [Sphingobacteriaceae bacterium WQ 2009]